MKYAIVYSSRTGNTAALAQALRERLPAEDCVYFGPPGETIPAAELVFAGFWTDKGVCDEAASAFLKTLGDQKVFLLGTAGFGGGGAYFEQILSRVKALLAPSVVVVGTFLCQGRMPTAVLARYEAMLTQGGDTDRVRGMIENYHAAASHPDPQDLERLCQTAQQALNTCRENG